MDTECGRRYRDEAAQCLALAEQASYQETRALLQRIAELYRQLAELSEARARRAHRAAA